MVLVARLSFRAHKYFAACTVRCPQGQKVLETNLGYRAFEDCRPAGSLADFPSNLWCELRIGRLFHHPERLLNFFFRHKAEKGRLFELHGQPLPECSIEDGVSRRVSAVGENDGALIGEFRSAMKIEVTPNG